MLVNAPKCLFGFKHLEFKPTCYIFQNLFHKKWQSEQYHVSLILMMFCHAGRIKLFLSAWLCIFCIWSQREKLLCWFILYFLQREWRLVCSYIKLSSFETFCLSLQCVSSYILFLLLSHVQTPSKCGVGHDIAKVRSKPVAYLKMTHVNGECRKVK